MLSRLRVDAKTNDYQAALELLQTLVLKGRVVVEDAMFRRRDLCEPVPADGGDDLVAINPDYS